MKWIIKAKNVSLELSDKARDILVSISRNYTIGSEYGISVYYIANEKELTFIACLPDDSLIAEIIQQELTKLGITELSLNKRIIKEEEPSLYARVKTGPERQKQLEQFKQQFSESNVPLFCDMLENERIDNLEKQLLIDDLANQLQLACEGNETLWSRFTSWLGVK